MEPGIAGTGPTTGRTLLYGELTRQIIGAFFEAYRILRPGFLESTYTGAMALELTDRGIAFEREARLDVFYKGRVAGVYRPDFAARPAVAFRPRSQLLPDHQFPRPAESLGEVPRAVPRGSVTTLLNGAFADEGTPEHRR
jgi:hypothetical protein